MSGLVGYRSSDEDNENSDSGTNDDEGCVSMAFPRTTNCCVLQKPTDVARNTANALQSQTPLKETTVINDNNTASSSPFGRLQPSSSTRGLTNTDGPSLGPTAPPTTSTSATSPYSTNRSLIQELTLPVHANLNIPPSPPYSPYPGFDERISHFLTLKHQDIHFNAKLAASSALKNPSLLAKLIESAGLNDDGAQDQYSSTLPTELWDPHGFSVDVHKGGLARMQREVEKRIIRDKKGADREFVAEMASGNG